MDKRDIGILLIAASFITTLAKALYLAIAEALPPIEIYIGVGSDPYLFLANLAMYLLGGYLIVVNTSKEIRDLWLNLLFFLIPSITLAGTIFYILAVGGAASLTLLVETAQFPLYHVLLTILAGIIIVLAGATPNRNRLLYGLSFVAVIFLYGLIRIYIGIMAPIVFGFIGLVIAMAILLTKNLLQQS